MSKKQSNGGKTRFMLCLLLSILLSANMYAQQLLVKGHIKDATGEPIIGANVVEKGTTNGMMTDMDGNFELQVKPNAMLVVSYIGYTTLEMKAQKQMTILLKEDTQMLNDVVVIGYGAVKKSDATGSVIALKQDKIGQQTSAQDALVGKVAGVNVVAGSGAPGSGATIRIRSGASLSASNDPLIVIDGIPVDNSGIVGAGNVIGSINPNDIETFTVLKDASATAIYGSRASNGVIIITTKKGADGGVKMNYTGNFSVGSITKKMDVLSTDEFKSFVPTVTGVPTQPQFGGATTDWQNEIYRTAIGQEHNFSLSGAVNKQTPYRVSLGYTNQDGIIKTNNYQRLTASGGISSTFFDNHLKIDLNAKYSKENNHQVSDGVVGSAVSYDPTRPVKTGSATATTDPGLGYFIWMNGNSPMAIQADNPVAVLELTQMKNEVSRFMGNMTADYKVHGFEDLRLNLNMGYDGLTGTFNKAIPELAGMMYTQNQKNGTGLQDYAKQEKRNTLLDLYANYTHTFAEKHDLNIMGGYGWQHFWKRQNSTTNDTKGAELASPKHYESEYYLLSFYGRANYTFADRYMITATLRSDASSRFNPNNRWGIFPSVALGWRINQENWLKDSEIVSDLKLRLSYGVTGQQDIINDYPYMSTFTVSYPESCYQFGDQWYHTYRPNGYDFDIKWETTTTYNVGIDFGFLKNRIYGSIDVYKRYTKDLLNKINVIAGTNYAPVLFTNIGRMENSGVEISLNAVPVHTKDWEWTVGMNYTRSNSKITKLNVVDSNASFVETGFISGTGKYVQVFMVDETPYTFYLAKQAYDDNGKPLEGQYIQPDGSVSTTESRYATKKSALPHTLLGLNTKVNYKNWDLVINGHGAFGNYIYNFVAADQYKEQVYSDQGSYSNILKRTMDNGFNQQRLYTDYFLENGSFFRIDNISLGYTFKRVWNSTSTLRANFSVQNVALITSYSGMDPEIYQGIDKEIYPRPRTFTLGLNLTF